MHNTPHCLLIHFLNVLFVCCIRFLHFWIMWFLINNTVNLFLLLFEYHESHECLFAYHIQPVSFFQCLLPSFTNNEDIQTINPSQTLFSVTLFWDFLLLFSSFCSNSQTTSHRLDIFGSNITMMNYVFNKLIILIFGLRNFYDVFRLFRF